MKYCRNRPRCVDEIIDFASIFTKQILPRVYFIKFISLKKSSKHKISCFSKMPIISSPFRDYLFFYSKTILVQNFDLQRKKFRSNRWMDFYWKPKKAVGMTIFPGKRQAFNYRFWLSGTPFQYQVVVRLSQKFRFGETTSY